MQHQRSSLRSLRTQLSIIDSHRRGELVLHEHAFLVYDPHSQRARQWVAQAKRSPAARAVRDPELRAMLCHSMAFQLLYAQVCVHIDANLHDVLRERDNGFHVMYDLVLITTVITIHIFKSSRVKIHKQETCARRLTINLENH